MEWKIMFIAIFSGIWCFLGIVFLMVSIIISSVRANKEKRCTSKTVGTVTDLVRHSAGMKGHSGSWYPVISYTVSGGENIVKESSVGTNPPKYKVGQTVHIRYAPDKTDSFYIDGDNTANLLKKIFFFVGLGLIAVGLTVGILVFIFA